MSVNVRVLNDADSKSANITINLSSRILASTVMGGETSTSFSLSFSTTARTTGGTSIPVLTVETDSDLVLGTKQRRVNTADAYEDLTELVEDYIYDIVMGHSADQHGTGVPARLGIEFR